LKQGATAKKTLLNEKRIKKQKKLTAEERRYMPIHAEEPMAWEIFILLERSVCFFM
jgi:hypothetical protein